MVKNLLGIIGIILAVSFALMCSGCRTEPVIIDTADIERLRNEYNELRTEYDRLQSDYTKLTEDSNFYADYYQQSTATIESGVNELNSIGESATGEITKLRNYVTILRNIVQGIINAQSGITGREPGVNGATEETH